MRREASGLFASAGVARFEIPHEKNFGHIETFAVFPEPRRLRRQKPSGKAGAPERYRTARNTRLRLRPPKPRTRAVLGRPSGHLRPAVTIAEASRPVRQKTSGEDIKGRPLLGGRRGRTHFGNGRNRVLRANRGRESLRRPLRAPGRGKGVTFGIPRSDRERQSAVFAS